MSLPDPLFHLGITNRTKGRLLVLVSPSDRCSSRNHILRSYVTRSADDSRLMSYIWIFTTDKEKNVRRCTSNGNMVSPPSSTSLKYNKKEATWRQRELVFRSKVNDVLCIQVTSQLIKIFLICFSVQLHLKSEFQEKPWTKISMR